MTFVTPPNNFFPKKIGTLQTTVGSAKTGSGYGEHNMAFHVADFPLSVHHNRMKLLKKLPGVNSIHWLTQVHGTQVQRVDNNQLSVMPVQADALVTSQTNTALAIMTADCLPIVMCDANGKEVAALHAGWRGLLDGIIEATCKSMSTAPNVAWIGSSISQKNFEVGEEVVTKFTKVNQEFSAFFTPAQQKNNKFLGDLNGIATYLLEQQGIQVSTHSACSYASDDFYSYRKATHQQEKNMGRMATLIWINE